MNPKEFAWDESQTVTVVNPTPDTYTFQVHSKQYEVGAGQKAKMPGFIAWVYVYGMASQLAQADGQFSRWNEEGFRDTYYSKVVEDTENVVQEVHVEPEPVVETFEEPEVPVETKIQPMKRTPRNTKK